VPPSGPGTPLPCWPGSIEFLIAPSDVCCSKRPRQTKIYKTNSPDPMWTGESEVLEYEEVNYAMMPVVPATSEALWLRQATSLGTRAQRLSFGSRRRP
jgi:hypothetical protein